MTDEYQNTSKSYFDFLSRDHKGVIRMVWRDFFKTLKQLNNMSEDEFVNEYINYVTKLSDEEYNDKDRRYLFKKENIANQDKLNSLKNMFKETRFCNCAYKTDSNLYIFAYHLWEFTWH